MQRYQSYQPPLVSRPVPGAVPTYSVVQQGAYIRPAGILSASPQLVGAPVPVALPPQPLRVQTVQPVQLQQRRHDLPDFTPPSFEQPDGALPCPESPGSTPRGEEEQSTGGAILPDGTEVEYRSRTADRWIRARIEGYNSSTGEYRLDVQPHARPDRIRPVQQKTPGGPALASGAKSLPVLEVPAQLLPPPAPLPPEASPMGLANGRAPPSIPEDVWREVEFLRAENARLKVQLQHSEALREMYMGEVNELRGKLHHQLQELPVRR